MDTDIGICNLKYGSLDYEKWHFTGNDFRTGKTNPHIKKEMSKDKYLYNRRQFTHV